MKINSKEIILDLSGKPLRTDNQDLTIGQVVANALLAPRKNGDYFFDKVRLLILAQDLYKGVELEVNAVDLDKIVKTMETDESWAPLITARAVMSLKALK